MNGPTVSLPEKVIFPIPAAELDANNKLDQHETYR